MNLIIIKPTTYSGLGSYIWQALRAMYHYPDKEYYIDFTISPYSDVDTKQTANVWDYFFEQPYYSCLPKEYENAPVVGNIERQESEYRDVFMENPTQQLIEQRRHLYNKIISKNIKLLPHISKKINDFTLNNFSDQKILGVHLRGTDHPEKGNIDEYVTLIQSKQNEYDKIFVCTDEQSRLDAVQKAFGDKVIFYNSTRSDTAAPLHHTETNQQGYKYEIAENVLVETFLLANTCFLMCLPNSNINYLARAINPNLAYMARRF